mgnify:CR=1 FL=1
MRILGIDPGLYICGYAVLENNQNKMSLIEAGIFKTDKKKNMPFRLNQIAADISSILQKFTPDIVAVEELYSHYQHPKTSILMGHARGVILQRCAEVGIEVKSFAATKIKKAITGNGRATKIQMQKTIQALLSLAEMPEPNDVADAIAATLCCINSINEDLIMSGR